MHTSVLQTERPRNLNVWHAMGILYGDWGTSKAYVIGLAFALAGYSSFWLVVAVCVLMALVGFNYMTICRYYPNGGGVYASVRHRSEVLALVGGFFLIADYVITASISSLSAFSYLGVERPELWAIGTIFSIGLLNFLGPRNTGNLAIAAAFGAFFTVLVLGFLSLFYVGEAAAKLQPLSGDWKENWFDFVGIIVALSGVEAIANTTGVMKLDPNSSKQHPTVTHTSTPAILAVMLEVCIFTALFSFMVNALPGLSIEGEEVSAPGYPNVRDSMLRYMAEVFGSGVISEAFGQIFSYVITISFAVLLLSAVNTALVALTSLLFVLSRDGQMPRLFQKMNRFGVPILPLCISTVAPVIVLVFVHDMVSLASLYAVGFVGAIATNLGSTSTDSTLNLHWRERVFMFFTFCIMASIEVTLFIEKDHARNFVIAVIAIGLLLRAFVMEQKEKKRETGRTARILSLAETTKEAGKKSVIKPPATVPKKKIPASRIKTLEMEDRIHIHTGPILCAVNHVGKSLEFSLREAIKNNQHLYILFIREQKIMPTQDLYQDWLEDELACEIFDYSLDNLKELNFTFIYDVSDLPALNIISHANDLKVAAVVLGMTRRNRLLQMIHGNVIGEVHRHLPPEIDLIVVS